MSEAINALNEHGSIRKAAASLGIAPSTLQGRLARDKAARGEVGGPPIPPAAQPPEGFLVRKNSGQYDAKGNLQKQWVQTSQGNTDEWAMHTGHVVKGESVFLDANGHTIARWVKTREGSGEGFVHALRAAFADYEGKATLTPAPAQCEDDVLTVYPIPDLHLGMYSWGAETGADYDVSIATQVATEGVGNLVAQSRASSHAIVLILGDYFHQNDQKNATPGSGHQLDVDSRWPLVYRAGAELALKIIDMVSAKHGSVEVVVLPGNHDPDAAVTLAIALSLFYSRSERITVNITPGVTWYRRFGQNLFGANHGHTMRTAEKMAMAMAVDKSEDWGKARHRFIWTGHLHHEVLKEVAGVRVETLSSPAARDAWNSASGYRSNRALQGITIHRDNGEIGRHRVNIVGSVAATPTERSV